MGGWAGEVQESGRCCSWAGGGGRAAKSSSQRQLGLHSQRHPASTHTCRPVACIELNRTRTITPVTASLSSPGSSLGAQCTTVHVLEPGLLSEAVTGALALARFSAMRICAPRGQLLRGHEGKGRGGSERARSRRRGHPSYSQRTRSPAGGRRVPGSAPAGHAVSCYGIPRTSCRPSPAPPASHRCLRPVDRPFTMWRGALGQPPTAAKGRHRDGREAAHGWMLLLR